MRKIANTLLDAFRAVGNVVLQSVISGTVALTIAFVFTLGFFWSGRSPAKQSRVEFIAANMGYLSLFFTVSLAVGFSSSLSKFRWIQRPERDPSQLFWFVRLVRATWVHAVATTAWIVGVSVASTKLSDRWKPYAIHFYFQALAVQYYLAVLNVASRNLYRTETTEGAARPQSDGRPMSKWKRILGAYINNIGFLVSVYVASVYIHLSSRLKLENQETFVVFSVASMVLRIVIMKILLCLVTRKQKIHVRLLYVLTSVPTVMIGTQVRIALLRVQGTVSTTSVVVLAVIEPVMRLLKVWRVRREVSNEYMQSGTAVVVSSRFKSGSIVPNHNTNDSIHPAHKQTLKSIPSRLSHSTKPSQLLLQFTAAEIHADMCSEYIAIASSLAIFYCFDGHPQFSWSMESSTSSQASGSRHVSLVLLQIAIELVVDTVCCLWEIVNGIPLRTSRELNRFLLGLFAGCTVTNICTCCAIYVR